MTTGSTVTRFRYGFATHLAGVGWDEARERVTAALSGEGFGVLTEIDVRATLKKKLDVDFRRYVILGACNPALAHRALRADGRIGLLLPCNVVLEEDGDGVKVSVADPAAMFDLVDDPAVEPVAVEAEQRLRRAVDALARKQGK